MNFDTMPPVLEHIKAGKLRALAISTPQRLPQLPDVPTFDEVGINGFDVTNWYAVMGPRGLPADVVAKIDDAMKKAMRDPASGRGWRRRASFAARRRRPNSRRSCGPSSPSTKLVSELNVKAD